MLSGTETNAFPWANFPTNHVRLGPTSKQRCWMMRWFQWKALYFRVWSSRPPRSSKRTLHKAKSTANRAYPQREKTEGKRVCDGTCTVSIASEHRDLRLMTVTGRGECVRGIQVARTLFPHKPARLETCQSEANERLRRANWSYGWPSGICLHRPWICLDPVGTFFFFRGVIGQRSGCVSTISTSWFCGPSSYAHDASLGNHFNVIIHHRGCAVHAEGWGRPQECFVFGGWKYEHCTQKFTGHIWAHLVLNLTIRFGPPTFSG